MPGTQTDQQMQARMGQLYIGPIAGTFDHHHWRPVTRVKAIRLAQLAYGETPAQQRQRCQCRNCARSN